MMTAIFTNSANATLTIETSEPLSLVQMGNEGHPIALSIGVNQVSVGSGVFKVFSKGAVHVTSDTSNLYVAYTNTKDGGFPDPPKLPITTDSTAVHQFFADVRSQPAPR